jgi:hypothetical protein
MACRWSSATASSRATVDRVYNIVQFMRDCGAYARPEDPPRRCDSKPETTDAGDEAPLFRVRALRREDVKKAKVLEDLLKWTIEQEESGDFRIDKET